MSDLTILLYANVSRRQFVVMSEFKVEETKAVVNGERKHVIGNSGLRSILDDATTEILDHNEI